MKTRRLEIYVDRYDESGVLIIRRSDIPGLHLEADTMDEMVQEIKTIAPILMDANMVFEEGTEIFLEVLLYRHSSVKHPRVPHSVEPRLLIEQEMAVAS